MDRILSRALYKSFPGKNLNFDKAHTKPLSLLRLDSSTYTETLIYGNKQVEFVDRISKLELPVQIFDLNGLYDLQQKKPLDPCPYFVEPLTEYNKTNTGIPRLTRFLWQPKNHAMQNSRHAKPTFVF